MGVSSSRWDRTPVHATRTRVSAIPTRTLGLARFGDCGGVRVTGRSGRTSRRPDPDTRHRGDEVRNVVLRIAVLRVDDGPVSYRPTWNRDQSALRTLEWVARAENLALSGPSGTGKSHFVGALAHAVIDAGMRVAWFTLESLTTTVGRAKVDASVSRVVPRICRSELIVVDDIGMLPAGQDAAEAFYRVVDAAHERRSVAVTRTLHPSGFAQDPGHRHRRPAAPPRPSRAGRGRFPSPLRSRRRRWVKPLG
jgi:hypothetical protein